MEEVAFDIDAMIAEVAKRHKIVLAPDDPAFALVTLNEVMLRQTMMMLRDHIEEVEQALSRESEKQIETAKAIAEALIRAAAVYVAERFKEAAEQAHAASSSNITKPVPQKLPARTALTVAAIVYAFLCGFLVSSILH